MASPLTWGPRKIKVSTVKLDQTLRSVIIPIDLPVDLLLEINEYLSIPDLLQLSSSCRYLFRILFSEDPRKLWRKLRRRDICDVQTVIDNLNGQFSDQTFDRELYVHIQREIYFLSHLETIEYAASHGYEKLLVSTFEQKRSRAKFDLGEALCCALRGNHIHIIDAIFELEVPNLNPAMIVAAQYGHRKYVELFLFAGANSMNKSLGGACRGGHLDIAKMLILNHGAIADKGLGPSVEGGHIEITDWLLQNGAQDFHRLYVAATKSGNLDLIERLLPAHPLEVHDDLYERFSNRLMWTAAQYGHTHIINRMMQLGPPRLRSAGPQHPSVSTGIFSPSGLYFGSPEQLSARDDGYTNVLVAATNSNNIELVQDLIHRVLDDSSDDDTSIGYDIPNEGDLWNDDSSSVRPIYPIQRRRLSSTVCESGLQNAARNGNLAIVNLMIDYGAKNLSAALGQAVISCNIEVVTRLLELGAGNCDPAHLLMRRSDLPTRTMNTLIIDRVISSEEFSRNGKAVLGRNCYVGEKYVEISPEILGMVGVSLPRSSQDFLNYCLEFAAERGDLPLAKQMLSLGANNLDKAMSWAAICGYLGIVKLLVSHGARDLKLAGQKAGVFGYPMIAAYFESIEYLNLPPPSHSQAPLSDQKQPSKLQPSHSPQPRKSPAEGRQPPKSPAEGRQPSKSQPSKTRPTQSQPAQSQPSKSQPAQSQPSKSQPGESSSSNSRHRSRKWKHKTKSAPRPQ